MRTGAYRSTFYHHGSKARALLFYVFDVLIYHGRSLLDQPLTTRREVLRQLASSLGKAGPVAVSEGINGEIADLIRVAKEFGFEGSRSETQRLPIRIG
jgi:ATP-dependent DNA ligase